jgi:hypothetical protein
MISRRYGRSLSPYWRGRPKPDAAKVNAAERFHRMFVVITNVETPSAESASLAT